MIIVEKDIFAYNSSESIILNSRIYFDTSSECHEFSDISYNELLSDLSYSEYSIGNISSKDLAESSRTNRLTPEKDYVGITNSEDQDELEIPDEKNLNRRLG
ncbi:unnamed protein product [Rhizophagus irregularis]|nr:unnamed protein product [Rhizophagus irregularis]